MSIQEDIESTIKKPWSDEGAKKDIAEAYAGLFGIPADLVKVEEADGRYRISVPTEVEITVMIPQEAEHDGS